MKKLPLFILVFWMLAVLSACGGKSAPTPTAQPSAAFAGSDGGARENPAQPTPDASAAPMPEPSKEVPPVPTAAPTPEPAAETNAPALPPVEETAPEESQFPEGSFPGGLDDDGLGPDEVPPAEEIPMSPEQQYEANVFLSNFAEQLFGDFTGEDGDTVSRAVGFAHIWDKINDHTAIAYLDHSGSTYETLTLDQVNDVVYRFLGFRISAWAADNQYPATEYSFFEDGLFYFLAADGESYNRVAVADSLTRMSDGTYNITFTVYEVDLWEYFDQGIDRSYYYLTPGEAENAASLTPETHGSARAVPYDYNGRATYQLLEYTVW